MPAAAAPAAPRCGPMTVTNRADGAHGQHRWRGRARRRRAGRPSARRSSQVVGAPHASTLASIRARIAQRLARRPPAEPDRRRLHAAPASRRSLGQHAVGGRRRCRRTGRRSPSPGRSSRAGCAAHALPSSTMRDRRRPAMAARSRRRRRRRGDAGRVRAVRTVARVASTQARRQRVGHGLARSGVCGSASDSRSRTPAGVIACGRPDDSRRRPRPALVVEPGPPRPRSAVRPRRCRRPGRATATAAPRSTYRSVAVGVVGDRPPRPGSAPCRRPSPKARPMMAARANGRHERDDDAVRSRSRRRRSLRGDERAPSASIAQRLAGEVQEHRLQVGLDHLDRR